MSQPKTPPLSIRVPTELLALVDELAAKRGIKRHAVILQALTLGLPSLEGLVSLAKWAKELPAQSGPLTGTAIMARAREVAPVRPPKGVDAMPTAKAVSGRVPLIKRKAFNPQPKKPLKR